MTARDHDWRDDYQLAVVAFRLCSIDLERRLHGDLLHKQQVALLVRRLIAAGYDAEDCLRSDAPTCYRREVFAVARALAGMAPL